MFIIDELKPYLDSIGLVQDKPGQLSGNGIIYTAETFLTFSQTHEPMPWNAKWQQECLVIPGLWQRHSDPRGFRDSPESIDDYLGLAYLSWRTDPSIAQQILVYGRSNFYKFGPFNLPYFYANGDINPKDTVGSWLGRFPSLIYCLQIAAGEMPSLWRKTWFNLSLALTNTKDTNQCRLARLMAAFQPNSLATRIYHDNMRSTWAPGGTTEEAMQKMYASYWGDSHPTGRYARG